MPCSLLTQPDWLDYANGSSTLAKAAYIIVCASCITILGFIWWFKSQWSSCGAQNDSVSGALSALLWGSIITLAIVVTIIIMDKIATITIHIDVPFVTMALVLLVALSVFLVISVMTLQIAYSKEECPFDFPNFIWLPVTLICVITLIIFYYRARHANDANILKQDVNWSNFKENSDLINEITEKQAKKCGVTIGAGQGLDAMMKYLSSEAAKNALSKDDLLKMSIEKRKWPSDKIPNIIKMHTWVQNKKRMNEASLANTTMGIDKLRTQQQTAAEEVAKTTDNAEKAKLEALVVNLEAKINAELVKLDTLQKTVGAEGEYYDRLEQLAKAETDAKEDLTREAARLSAVEQVLQQNATLSANASQAGSWANTFGYYLNKTKPFVSALASIYGGNN